MNNSDGNFTKLKRWMIGASGILIAICSVILTKQGVGITGQLAWMGTSVAFALFCAELMFNSNFEELNWTIILLGIGAYVYSIWTNIEGLYFYRGIEGDLFSNFNTTNFGGGMFMDIYPELAIAWAMKESKIGDLLGNFVKTLRNPDKLTEPAKRPQQQSQNQQRQEPKPEQRQEQTPKANYGYGGQSVISQIQQQQQKSAPRPQNQQREQREPTYHPVSYQGQELPEFLKNRKSEN